MYTRTTPSVTTAAPTNVYTTAANGDATATDGGSTEVDYEFDCPSCPCFRVCFQKEFFWEDSKRPNYSY
ncbi:hypothetical protein T10_13119 [Trichinella papuae]|uniref:Uncharacterized protein n=1 Tax=Trichinella papuae TaxID=268474 RepID=A0A0V1N5K3_9BILA|nr:hypothetical protein T10_13119 [Trichinella papuae]